MSFFENTRKPVGLGGKLMVAMMNLGHSPVARWGLQFLNAAPDAKVLDCGCGGGANMKRLLKKCPQGIVKGIDYSPVSGMAFCTRGSCASKVMILLTPIASSSCRAMAQSSDSRPLRLCWRDW